MTHANKLKLGAIAAGTMTALLLASTSLATADTPADVLVQVGEAGPNSLDPMAPAANELSQMVAWQIYDRLVTHGLKTLPDGTVSYDVTKIEPQLAESWDISEDGTEMVFHLRQDAMFHDGTPVTAEDVRWSFARAVAAGGFPAVQMAAGSMTDPDMFSVVDEHTFKITLDAPNKLTLPDLAVPVPDVVNKDLALEHATEDDPWALQWTAQNDAGSGPFEVTSWKPGNQIVFSRFEDWKSGPLPEMRRVIYREVPSAGTRRALLEKGDVDVSSGLPPKDYAEMAEAGQVKVIGSLMQNEMFFVDMNTKIAPFDNKLVRQAVAYALPYDAIMSQALYDRGEPMYGADASSGYAPEWPVASPYDTDLDKARELLAEAGLADGFATDLYIDMSQTTIQEPMALLIKEQLAKIGIDITINKVPGSDWFARMGSQTMPMDINYFYGWLDYPEYFYFWTYDGITNAVFNTPAYNNPELDAMTRTALSLDGGAEYDQTISAMNAIVMEDVPRAPVAHLYSDIAMQQNVEGYVYWFHTNLDYRFITKN
ncbi:ABC transporter substrate-binding protein [Falsirhodobacter sp. alg1]|uniref:ABC transporter substrate-binding protein n=1 Tax=Falsirhodobacter sp. alg1 TaxID=1472418 RepID=UPI0005F03218|nr:ABC transporter substrate-binding protein [Falsirhodobacter sp. alg1]